MAKIVTLKNSSNEEVYPVTVAEAVNGGLYADNGTEVTEVAPDVTTSRIEDGAVTAAKIDFSTIGALNYSTSETTTGGTWVDGSPIYQKTIPCGALPNATTISVAHHITGLNHIIDLKGVAWTSSGTTINLPYTNPQGVQYQVTWYVDKTYINIGAGDNKSGYSNCYVTLYYTKS